MSRPAVEELETQPEAETAMPQWMKDAERKRRRVSDLFLVSEHEHQEHALAGDFGDHPVAPWMKEHALRKAARPGPVMVTHKNLLNVPDSKSVDSLHATGGDLSANQSTPSAHHVMGDSNLNSNDSIIDKSPPKMKADTSVVVADEKIKVMSRNSAIGINFVSSQLKSNKEILQPIKKTETIVHQSQPMQKTDTSTHQPIKAMDTSTEQDEHKPPANHGLDKIEIPTNKSHVLPPIKTPVRAPMVDAGKDKEEDQSAPPTPQPGVVMRKKSASNKPSYRPMTVDASMKMWETPDWKKQLVEKKKKRESLGPMKFESEEKIDEEAESALPPWQRELEVKKKRQSFTTHKGNLGVDSSSGDLPEWMKAVQKRRSRLAEKGYIQDDENEAG